MKNFEERLNRLEEINSEIKGGGNLDQSLKLFEEGGKTCKGPGKGFIESREKNRTACKRAYE